MKGQRPGPAKLAKPLIRPHAAVATKGTDSLSVPVGDRGHGQLPQPQLSLVLVKQRQQPFGQLHSEHRIWQQPLLQQYQEPPVVQPDGHPPPTSHDLHVDPMVSHWGNGDTHAPPMQLPQPAHASTAARASRLPVRKTPTESAAPAENLKKPRREDLRASHATTRPGSSSIDYSCISAEPASEPPMGLGSSEPS